MRTRGQRDAATTAAPPPRRAAAAEPQDACADEVRRLGEALGARADEVVARASALGPSEGPGSRGSLAPAVIENFERIGRSATVAVARWMAGGNPQEGWETGREAWQTYGQLAAQSAAPLHEVTKRCLRWRDAVGEVLRDGAREGGVSDEALARALTMTQHTLDVTLVRICEAFELERERTARELCRREEELAFMATHDQLTGLPNRTLILDRGEQMLGRARRRHTPVAAIVIDLDNFTSINDTLGHAAGDELLQAIAVRLDGVVRDIDALARLGGDLFVVLAEDLSSASEAEMIAERLRAALRTPFVLAGAHAEQPCLTVTASIGVAVGPRVSIEDLLRDADIAMHRAKWDGKDRHVVFEDGMQDVVQSRMELEMELRGALAAEEFFLVYQPTFDLREMVPTGVEALIRWRSPLRGVVQPVEFIPLLEETGLIVDVGRWVLEQACTQGARWRDRGQAVSVAVNVSPRQLETDEFVGDVRAALARSGLEARSLTLEITETTLMRSPEQTGRRLRAIKDLGVRIAIDDFGTGYSSLSYLKQLPVHEVKIDKSFVFDVEADGKDAAIVRSVVAMAHALGMDVVAEGVENEDAWRVLRALGCDVAQGYHLSRPLPLEELDRWLNGSAWACKSSA